MPTLTYKPLATKSLTAAAAIVTFSTIASTYRDLIIVAQMKPVTAGSVFTYQFNNDATTSAYKSVNANGDGTSATSGTASTTFGYLSGVGNSSDLSNMFVVHVMDYSATDKNKTVLSRHSNTLGASMNAGVWLNTAAINTITLKCNTGNLDVGSTFTLYGVAA